MFGLMETGFQHFYWGNAVMIIIALVFIYLGIGKKMEPLLLIPIGFGMLLVNLPLGGLMDYAMDIKAPVSGNVIQIQVNEGAKFKEGDILLQLDSGDVSAPTYGKVDKIRVSPGQHVDAGDVVASTITTAQTDQSKVLTSPEGILARIFKYGIMWHIIPPLIFLCLGALTDFGPMIANPKTLFLGAGAQFGVYFAFFGALLCGFTMREASSIGIIGGAEGPTTILVTSILAPHIISTTAMACYSYMALVPIIQPPIIKLFTSKAERAIYMKPELREVPQLEKIIFPILCAIISILFVPMSAPLMGLFMIGNLFRECGVLDRLSDTASTSLVDILTIFITLAIGGSMVAENFLRIQTLLILVLGAIAFAAATAAGVILAKTMNLFSKEKINPMIGAAGVSAVPMSARVVQEMGQKENFMNILLMHAMGPNVAGAIGAAVAGGVFLSMLK